MITAPLQRAFLLTGLIGMATLTPASADTEDTAALRLVQTQLPAGTDPLHADGSILAQAVGRAVLDHRAQAPAILAVALSGGAITNGNRRRPTVKRTCDFVVRVYKAALTSAPEQASQLTEETVALYPACADQLAAALHEQEQRVTAYDYKDRPDYKDRTDYKDRADYKDATTAPVAGIRDSGDPGDDLGFGVGFGPGFPGSPGFVGSPPSGGFALPPVALPTPGTQPVTSVVNQ